MSTNSNEKIRVKLESFNHQLLTLSCQKIIDIIETSKIKKFGLISLPTNKRIYCVLRSPHVDKDSREHFEIRVHRRIVDIFYQYEPEYTKQPVLEKLSQVEFDPGLFCSISYD